MLNENGKFSFISLSRWILRVYWSWQLLLNLVYEKKILTYWTIEMNFWISQPIAGILLPAKWILFNTSIHESCDVTSEKAGNKMQNCKHVSSSYGKRKSFDAKFHSAEWKLVWSRARVAGNQLELPRRLNINLILSQ